MTRRNILRLYLILPLYTDSEIALARQVRRQRYCRDLLYRGQAEQSYTATHTATGVVVKLRPDLLISSRAGRQLTLIDFKTTSSPDLPHFLTTIERYDYDRQAALYLDVLGATRFLIIGVQKKAPHEVWRVELMATPDLFEQGRKKYTRLLRAFAERQSSSHFRTAGVCSSLQEPRSKSTSKILTRYQQSHIGLALYTGWHNANTDKGPQH